MTSFIDGIFVILSVKMSLYSVKVGARFSVADVLGRRAVPHRGKSLSFGAILIRIRILAVLLYSQSGPRQESPSAETKS